MGDSAFHPAREPVRHIQSEEKCKQDPVRPQQIRQHRYHAANYSIITRRRLVCYAYISQYITASCYHSLASGIVVSRRWLSWLIHANPKRTSTRKCRSALNRNSLSSLSHTANARSVPHRGSSARLFPSGLRNMIHDPFPMLPIPFYVSRMVSVVIFL